MPTLRPSGFQNYRSAPEKAEFGSRKRAKAPTSQFNRLPSGLASSGFQEPYDNQSEHGHEEQQAGGLRDCAIDLGLKIGIWPAHGRSPTKADWRRRKSRR